MEPIFPDLVNRNAFLLKAKQPFIDWFNQHTEEPLTDGGEGHIYLADDCATPEETEEWIRDNFELMFQNELQDWDFSGESWPKNRTYELFREWFEIEFHSIVFDLGKEPLGIEE